jgi:hypothetical protein
MQINFPSFSELLAFLLMGLPALLLARVLDKERTQAKAKDALIREQSKELSVLSPQNNLHFGDS